MITVLESEAAGKTAAPGEWALFTFLIRNLGDVPNRYSYRASIHEVKGESSKGRDITQEWFAAGGEILVPVPLGGGQEIQNASATGILHPTGGAPFLEVHVRVHVPVSTLPTTADRYAIVLRSSSAADETEWSEGLYILTLRSQRRERLASEGALPGHTNTAKKDAQTDSLGKPDAGGHVRFSHLKRQPFDPIEAGNGLTALPSHSRSGPDWQQALAQHLSNHPATGKESTPIHQYVCACLRTRAAVSGASQEQRTSLLAEARQVYEALLARYDWEWSARCTILEELGRCRRAQFTGNYDEILGISPHLLDVLEVIDAVADKTCSVLILGATGTGKELIAQALHRNSPRCKGPFVAVNCSVSKTIENDMFGTCAKSFTQVEERPGQFENAHTGTLFLDEIGDMSMDLQPTILRVLDSSVVGRLGGRQHTPSDKCGQGSANHFAIPIDVRYVCATNHDLEKAEREGTFRGELLGRISSIRVSLPSLAQRPEDIPALADFFLARTKRHNNLQYDVTFAHDLMAALRQYSWPRNVRQLEKTIDAMVACTRNTTVLSFAHLPSDIKKALIDCSGSANATQVPVTDAQYLEELKLFADAFRSTGMNRYRTMEILHFSQATFYRRRDDAIAAGLLPQMD